MELREGSSSVFSRDQNSDKMQYTEMKQKYSTLETT